MIFSDLLCDTEPVIQSLRLLRHGGHDVILFHVLDEAEVYFPFDGVIEFEEPETEERVRVDASNYRQELTKFDYAICLAASLCYLMVHQQDPVGLITFDQRVRDSLAPRSKRTQLANVLSHLARLQPAGPTDIANSIRQIAAM